MNFVGEITDVIVNRIDLLKDCILKEDILEIITVEVNSNTETVFYFHVNFILKRVANRKDIIVEI